MQIKLRVLPGVQGSFTNSILLVDQTADPGQTVGRETLVTVKHMPRGSRRLCVTALGRAGLT